MADSIFNRIVSDLKAFLKYLASLWGLLSLFSAFFPLINYFAKLIRLPSSYPDVSILLSTLGSVFVVFFQFTNRKETAKTNVKENGFGYAVALTLVYVLLPILPSVPPEIYAGWYLSTPWLRFLIEIVIWLWLLIEPALYIIVFYSFTRLFSILAVKEWQTRENDVKTKL